MCSSRSNVRLFVSCPFFCCLPWYISDSNSREAYAIAGTRWLLGNLGATCYFNVNMYLLRSIPLLRHFIRQQDHARVGSVAHAIRPYVIGELLSPLPSHPGCVTSDHGMGAKKLAEQVFYNCALAITSFKKTPLMATDRQEDALELFRYISEALLIHHGWDELTHLYGVYHYTCKICPSQARYSHDGARPFRIHIHIPTRPVDATPLDLASLVIGSDGLSLATQECDRVCVFRGHRIVNAVLHVTHFPPVLIVMMVRHSSSGPGTIEARVDTTVSFTHEVRPCADWGIILHEDIADIPDPLYRLQGVVLHTSYAANNAVSGHYTYCFRTTESGTSWVHLDDAKTPLQFEWPLNLQNPVLGDTVDFLKDAYCLVYTRVETSPSPPPGPDIATGRGNHTPPRTTTSETHTHGFPEVRTAQPMLGNHLRICIVHFANMCIYTSCISKCKLLPSLMYSQHYLISFKV